MKVGLRGAMSVLAGLVLTGAVASAADGPVAVEIKKGADGKVQLLRDGKPYFIKGGGGGGDKPLLAAVGGNSFRTWGVGNETLKELDQAEKLGLTVTVGYWLGHKQHGFDYGNAAAVDKQFDDVKKVVLKYKDHPALLMWSLGNEMENGNNTPELWKAVEALAKMVHEVDPKHPTMTVVAEVGGKTVENIHTYCPDIDVVGINSYAGGPSVGERYAKQGGTKPFVVTEFGPPGTWELKMNAFGAAPEPTSTEKAAWYRKTYEKTVLGMPGQCLGSYAFTWGFKIEATATWYGMFLPDGSKLGAVDMMQELWSGKAAEHPCPAIKKLAVVGADQVAGGETVKAEVDTADEKGDKLKIDWRLFREQGNYDVQGTGAAATPGYPEAIEKNGEREVTIKLPKFGGVYRIYCYIHNEHGGAAVGSLPVKVAGPEAAFEAAKARLPLEVIGEGEGPYIPSGYMGNTKAISMQADCADNPHTGKVCTKVEYKEGGNWAGVVWQSPANDWGEKPGGYDLTGATKLTFWARGPRGARR